MSRPVRVRFAPSPTGELHVGGVRTAFYNYLFAKSQKGRFILRIEDTDKERSTENFIRSQIEDLKWLGLSWDEGPEPDTLESYGPFGPYRQSERIPIYKKYAQKLLDGELAYYDFRSDLELEELRGESRQSPRPIPRPDPIVDPLTAQKRIKKGEKPALRFKVPDNFNSSIKDMIRGEVRLPEDKLTDFILLRSNSMPVYNFCCAIDDALMEISHVFRAEEHLTNSFRQKMIYEALGFPIPQLAHLSLVLGEDKQKLSKRHGTTSCRQYREKGCLPQALLNFTALLGWSPGNDREVMDLQEMIESFEVSGLKASGAVFDEEKFYWMNAVHLRLLPDEQLWSLLKPLLKKENLELPEDPGFIRRASELFKKKKMDRLNSALELFRPIDDKFFKVSEDSKEVLSWETSQKVLQVWKDQLEKMETEFMTEEEFDQNLNEVKSRSETKGRQLFMPLRVVVIGRPQGVDLKSLVPLLSKKSLLKRVKKVMDEKEFSN